MTLAAGTRLGPYEIQAALGAGGRVRFTAHATRSSRPPSPAPANLARPGPRPHPNRGGVAEFFPESTTP
jgi:hypothetical protein